MPCRSSAKSSSDRSTSGHARRPRSHSSPRSMRRQYIPDAIRCVVACLEVDAVMALAGGEAAEADRAAADGHLASCDRCRQLLAEMMRDSSIESLETAPASPAARSSYKSMLQYDIGRELGRGGMGQVVLARDTRLGRRVAIKLLHSASASLARRFLAEARTTAQLHHENIVVIHEVNEHEGQPFMVLEYLEGKPLSALVGAGPVPWRRAVELVMPVLGALAHAHEHGIVHRDLK